MGTKQQPVWRRSATLMIHAASNLKAAVEEQVHTATGLLLADNEALLALASTDIPLRMSDIADRLVLSRGGTTKVIDRLEALGHVVRSSDPADRRATTVTITDSGSAALARTGPIVDAALQDLWGRHLTDAQASAVLDAVDIVLHANDGWLH